MMADYSSDLSLLPTFAYDDQLTANQLNSIADALRWVHGATDQPAIMQALSEAAIWYTDAHMFLADLVIVHKMPFLVYRTWDTEDERFKDLEQPQLVGVGAGIEKMTISLSESVDDFLTVDLSRYEWLVDGTVYRLKNVRLAGEFMIPYVSTDDDEYNAKKQPLTMDAVYDPICLNRR